MPVRLVPSKLSIQVVTTAGFSVVEVRHPTKPGIMVQVHLVGHGREDGIVIEVQRAVMVEEDTRQILDVPYKGLILFRAATGDDHDNREAYDLWAL